MSPASRSHGVRADLHRDPSQVSEMFDEVARGYDATNVVLSVGLVFWWRRVVVAAVAPRSGQRLLDVAAGTGASSAPLARAGAAVTATDLSPGMLAEGVRRYGDLAGLRFVEAPATALPFDDDEFDTVTISFSLRNIDDPALALMEMLRVTRPGGRLVVAEFSQPRRRAWRRLYRWYRRASFPLIATRLSSNPIAYDYLRESIDDWVDPSTISSWCRAAGWAYVTYRNVCGGIVALHMASKPMQRGVQHPDTGSDEAALRRVTTSGECAA